jgi:glucuronoarabinoxylan endo-1,4-beta-xylanase
MATPWTAPAWMKTSNNVNGGSLKTDQYQAYADHLNSFVQQLRNSGVQLYAISVQNEPDIKVTYESMDWNPSQMVTFLKNFGSRIQGTKIMAAESFQFRKDITDAILVDK